MSNFADVMAAATPAASDLMLDFGSDSLLLVGVSSLDPDDVIT